jgi:hypothetical protein
MLRTIGYVFLVVTIGSVAIAWKGHETRTRALTLAPLEMQANTASLPTHEFTDRTFVFASED